MSFTLIIWALVVGIPIGTGYWCMRVFRRKARSPGAGFALGFFLAFLLPPLGTGLAVLISYTRTSRTLVATLAPAREGLWSSKITYDTRCFEQERVGKITAQDVLSFDAQGRLLWAHDAMRDWVVGMVAASDAGAV